MPLPLDEYYDRALVVLKEYEDYETDEQKESVLELVADGDLAVLERIIQLAIRSLQNDPI